MMCSSIRCKVLTSLLFYLNLVLIPIEKGAFQDSDVILLVTDLFSTPIPDDVLFQKIIDINSGKNASKTVIVLINKVRNITTFYHFWFCVDIYVT